MAIKKQFLKSKPVCKVTFQIESPEARTAQVIGSFNDWNAPIELKKQKGGVFKNTIELPANNSFEFRYLLDGTYVNDQEADGFQWSDYAGDYNSVLAV